MEPLQIKALGNRRLDIALVIDVGAIHGRPDQK